jgi:hypothetical protein
MSADMYGDMHVDMGADANSDMVADMVGDMKVDMAIAPTIVATRPARAEVGVAVNASIQVVFSEAMDGATLTASTFTLTAGAMTIPGAVSSSGDAVTFRPSAPLSVDTTYTATIMAGVKDASGDALAADYVWTFTTRATRSRGPAPVVLGTSGRYAILAKSGIDSVPGSVITGDIGVSPIDSTAITGFSLMMDATNTFATSAQVTGSVFAADYAAPTPTALTTAISDMETAYTDAAGRSLPDFTELGAGEIGGQTLTPGLYKWGTGVGIATDVTLDGGPDDVWIFQIAGDITQANGAKVILSGGASPKNIFWQSFGQVMIGTNARFEGVVLCETAIILGTGASINGRLLAQTAVTLDASTVTQPAP